MKCWSCSTICLEPLMWHELPIHTVIFMTNPPYDLPKANSMNCLTAWIVIFNFMNCAALIKRQFNSSFVFCFSQRYQFVRGDEVIDPYRLFADLCVWHNYICNSINIFAAERHTGRSLPTVDKLQKGVKTHSSPESLFDNCALAAITVGNDLCVVPQCTSWHGPFPTDNYQFVRNSRISAARPFWTIPWFRQPGVGAGLCSARFGKPRPYMCINGMLPQMWVCAHLAWWWGHRPLPLICRFVRMA